MKAHTRSILFIPLAALLLLLLGCSNDKGDSAEDTAAAVSTCATPEVVELTQNDDPCLWTATVSCGLHEFSGWNLDVTYSDDGERREPASKAFITGRCPDSQYCGYSNETTSAAIAIEASDSGFQISSRDSETSSKPMENWTINLDCGSIIDCCDDYESAKFSIGTAK